MYTFLSRVNFFDRKFYFGFIVNLVFCCLCALFLLWIGLCWSKCSDTVIFMFYVVVKSQQISVIFTGCHCKCINALLTCHIMGKTWKCINVILISRKNTNDVIEYSVSFSYFFLFNIFPVQLNYFPVHYF